MTSPIIHAGFAFSSKHIVVACLILISEVAAFEVLKKRQPELTFLRAAHLFSWASQDNAFLLHLI